MLTKKPLAPYLPWLLATASLAVAGYLAASAVIYRIGFPLDDAWIHLTYARNLALRGEWSFLPGQISAGSTAPLWSVLLAAGYLVNLAPYAWAYLLGGVSLVGVAWAGEATFRRVVPSYSSRIPWIGLFLTGEWHLVWAATSGMETPLIAFLILAVMLALAQPKPAWWLAGGLVGLTVWIRPDGLTLLGPVLFVLAFHVGSLREGARSGLQVVGSFLALFLPYLLFNQLLAGSWWPNTFYAKQTEYAILLSEMSLISRVWALVKLPLVGAGALLLPGVVWAVWRGWRQRRWVVVAAFLWWAGVTVIYALRLPVTYQHGRYLMPSMPVYFLLGWVGMAELLRPSARLAWQRILSRAWIAAAALVWLAFYGLGASTYGKDVAIIETEMVATAHWVAENTRPGDLIAAHDIGALGYFGERNLLDLAGLISPEVIPFMRDETRLAEFLGQRQVDYLVTFPLWYPRLIQSGQEVFRSGGTFAPSQGGENMVVYRWRD